MENNLPVIPIFFAVDDGYIPFLAVTLESLIDNASKKYYYSIKILYINISEENKKKITKYNRDNVNIEFVDLNYYIDEIKDKLYTRDYYTKTTYFRLFIPNLYPQYDKVIYLDSDLAVLGDISELYNIDIKGKLIAAAPDDAVQNVKPFQEYVEKVVGTNNYKNYFNAGILLMNLDELRRFKFQEKFMYLLGTMKFTVAQDQDYLNRLCKGGVKIIPGVWNRMPIPNENINDEDIKIIHFNLSYKPWHFENIMYQEHFWKYAKKTEFLNEINKVKETYTDEERFKDMEMFKKLKELAVYEADCVGDDRENRMKEINPDKRDERLKILNKIDELEEKGLFDVDVENDPPTIPLMPEDVDYLNEKSTSKLKRTIANKMGEKFLDELIKENKLIIKEINGMENLQAVKSGAIITCNHFNPFDCFAIEEVFRQSKQNKDKKLYKVIREGNYTNFPGLYGFFFRNCDTLPLSSNTTTMVEFMKAVDVILQRKDFILIYPEQSLWWNYRKPKPLKLGAYRFASRNNVPVIPIFITMEDTDIIDDDGFPIQEYTVNIEKPIYPDEELSEKENAKLMLKENSEVWKKVYEEFYEKPLEYTTKKEEQK